MFEAYLPRTPYLLGRHTRTIQKVLQRATETVERGECFYAAVSVPPRHGKSDLCARRYPAWHLARNPSHEIILASYSYDLARGMSLSARSCFKRLGGQYGLVLSSEQSTAGAWSVEEHGGTLYAVGLGGTINGRGANILVIDDYCKNREEAESETIREKVEESFKNDLMTRLAPAHAVIIDATRWGVDDLIGFIKNKNKKGHRQYDPDFPVFEIISFPAQNDADEWLFPERFSEEYYRKMKAAVGSYGWASLYQQEPRLRHGNMFKAERCVVEDKFTNEDLLFSRGWDLASTKQERCKNDPDFTVGIRAAWDGDDLWIADMRRGQWEAPERDRVIVNTSKADGYDVKQIFEVVAGYKDTFTRMETLLEGKAIVDEYIPRSKAVARSAYLEPIFEASKVHLLRGEWNAAFIDEVGGFPSARHDDILSSLVVATSDMIGTGIPSFGTL